MPERAADPVSSDMTTPFDATKYLADPEAQAIFLRDALETGDAGYIAHPHGVIARARGISQV